MDQSIKKILIIEDEADLISVLTNKLTSEGFIVLQARNGREGLDMALKHHPDLILLDIIMPEMDGMTMLGYLRQDSWGKNVEVIILTNLNEASKISEGLEKEVNDYLVKSDWTLEDLVKKIRDKLEYKL